MFEIHNNEDDFVETAQTAPEAPSSKLWAEPISSSAISLSWTPLQVVWLIGGRYIGFWNWFHRGVESGLYNVFEKFIELRESENVSQQSTGPPKRQSMNIELFC